MQLVKNFTYYDDLTKSFFVITEETKEKYLNEDYILYNGIDLTNRTPLQFSEHDKLLIDFQNQYNIITKAQNWKEVYREDGYDEDIFQTLFLMNEKYLHKTAKRIFDNNLALFYDRKENKLKAIETIQGFKGLYFSKSIGVYEIISVSDTGEILHSKDGVIAHDVRRNSSKIRIDQVNFFKNLQEIYSSLEFDYFGDKESLKLLFHIESFLRETKYLESLDYMNDNYGKEFSDFDFRENLLLAYDLFEVDMYDDFQEYISNNHSLFEYKEYKITEEELKEYNIIELCEELETYHGDLESNGDDEFYDTLKDFLLSDAMYFGWYVELARSPITDCRIYVLTHCKYNDTKELNNSYAFDYTEYASRKYIFELLANCKL